jgi:hypothetical protein
MPASVIVRMQGREPSIREYLACIVFEVVVQKIFRIRLGDSGQSGQSRLSY